MLASPDHAFTLSGYLSNRDKNYYASHYEALQGIKASLTANASSNSQHELAWELSWRQMNRLSPHASASIRKMARGGGHSIKSSLVHTFVSDTRDAVTPSQGGSEGRLVKSITEMAGLGGDAQFVKWEGQWGVNRSLETSLGSGWAWAAGARAGLMRPLTLPAFASGETSSSTATAVDFKLPFADRFQLGGPTCVRMFKMNSLGPKDGSEYSAQRRVRARDSSADRQLSRLVMCDRRLSRRHCLLLPRSVSLLPSAPETSLATEDARLPQRRAALLSTALALIGEAFQPPPRYASAAFYVCWRGTDVRAGGLASGAQCRYATERCEGRREQERRAARRGDQLLGMSAGAI